MILEQVRSQHVYITLLGPRNETLTGQLNMTDFQSLGRTGPRGDSAAVEPQDASAAGAGSTAKFYDSRGAAYYICVFILVYALAIVMFVASLARRRRSSYQNGGEFSRLPKSEMMHYYNNAELSASSSVRETTTTAERYSFAGAADDDNNPAAAVGLPPPARHSSTTMRFQRPARANRVVDSARGAREIELGKGDGGSSLPDELITLVQVLPCTEADANPEVYWDDDGTVSEHTHQRPVSSREQKCRWSIGPDGNLFILQVDENDSSAKLCLEESSHDQSVLKSIVTCKQDLNSASDKSEKDGLSSNSRTLDCRKDTPPDYADCYKNSSVSDGRRNTVSCAEKTTKESSSSSSINPPQEMTTCKKCDSLSLAEQDCIITDNNCNCDFENPWGLPTYPEIQKLVHVTSV